MSEINFTNLSEEELIPHLDKMNSLNPEDFLNLQTEFINRHNSKSIKIMRKFVSKNGIKYFNKQMPLLREIIDTQIENGIHPDSINHNLKLRGFDIKDIIKIEEEKEDIVLDKYKEYHKKGYSEEKIDELLEEEFEITRGQSEKIEQKISHKKSITIAVIIASIAYLMFRLFLRMG